MEAGKIISNVRHFKGLGMILGLSINTNTKEMTVFKSQKRKVTSFENKIQDEKVGKKIHR